MLLLLSPLAWSAEEGIVGYAWDGCGDCHIEQTADAVTTTLTADAVSVQGGESVAVYLTVTTTEPIHTQAGLDVGAEDGLLAPSATLLFRDYEITHQFPHDLTDGSMTFEMTWTAPAYAGTFTLSGVGNAVDGLSTATGDGWSRDELEITVISDCSDADGDRLGDCEGDCDDTDPTVQECPDTGAAQDTSPPEDTDEEDSGVAPVAPTKTCACGGESAAVLLLPLLLTATRRRGSAEGPGSGQTPSR